MRAMNRRVMGGLAAIAMALAAPVWANGGGRDGQGHGRGNAWGHDGGRGHGYGHGRHYWRAEPRHHHHFHERMAVREYWYPVPVYPRVVVPAHPAPSPGIHVVIPDIYIPF